MNFDLRNDVSEPRLNSDIEKNNLKAAIFWAFGLLLCKLSEKSAWLFLPGDCESLAKVFGIYVLVLFAHSPPFHLYAHKVHTSKHEDCVHA